MSASAQPNTAQPNTDPLDSALRALADGNRRSILALVRADPMAVGEIAEGLAISQQAASHHLKVLRTAGLVSETRDGVRHLFAVRTEGLGAVQRYLEDFWPDRLAALKGAVEATVDAKRGGARRG